MFPAEIDVQPRTYLEGLGPSFARFDTQDSGNVSYGVRAGDTRFFVKTAGDPADPDPYLSFEDRVALLRNAADLARSVAHPALPTLHAVIESPGGPLLVYDWRDGELLGDRGPSDSPHERFRALLVTEILAALDTLYELHAELDAAGWVEGDFYDGAMLYDFERRRLTVMDLDTYRREPHRNDMGRMFGSSRFMAPEQFSLGAPIDTRTTAYVLARTALIFLSDSTLDRPAFRASDADYAVLQEATTARFPSYAAFHAAWLAASATISAG
jgi:serine/threonine protein kinase, bacterial